VQEATTSATVDGDKVAQRGEEFQGASITANEASVSTAAERGLPRRKRKGAKRDEWCGEEEERRVGGRADGDAWAWAWAMGMWERPTICAHVRRKTRNITDTRNIIIWCCWPHEGYLSATVILKRSEPKNVL
jgi:hypothetical protein